jgi:hypothetical protein
MHLKKNVFKLLIGFLAVMCAQENKAQEQEIALRNNTKERALKIEEFYGNSRNEWSDSVTVLQPGQTAKFKFVKKDWRDGKSKELTSFHIEDQSNRIVWSGNSYIQVCKKPDLRYAYMYFWPWSDKTRIEMDVMPKVKQIQNKTITKTYTQQELSQLRFDIEEPEEDAFIVDPVDEKAAKEKDEQRAKEKAAAKQTQASQVQRTAKE